MSREGEQEAEVHPEDWAETPGLTRAVVSRSTTPKPIMPKGPLFTNLGEAHQAISSRSASRSAGNRVKDASKHPSSPSSLDISGQTSSVESPTGSYHTEFASSYLPVHSRCLTPFARPELTGAEGENTCSDRSPAISTLVSSTIGSNIDGGRRDNAARDVSGSSGTFDTKGTMENIYNHYIPSPIVKSASSPEALQSTTASNGSSTDNPLHRSRTSLQAVNFRTSSVRRAGGAISPSKSRWQMLKSAGEPPLAPFPELPRMREDTGPSSVSYSDEQINLSTVAQPADSSSNCQELSDMSINGVHGSEPGATFMDSAASSPPHPVQPTTSHIEQSLDGYDTVLLQPTTYRSPQVQANEEGDNSRRGASNSEFSTACTTDSDDDPFEYDRGSFTVYLQPSREREVSAALHCVSEDSTASAIGCLVQSPRASASPRRFSSKNPFLNRLQSYQTPTVEYDWDNEDGPREVKISIRPPPAAANAPAQPAVGLSGISEKPGIERRRQDIQTFMSDGADWETVVTSDQLDSNRALASSTGLRGGHPVKITGSSIADYSDTRSFYASSFNEFSPTERILQPPDEAYTPNARYRQTLNHGRRPGFLPKPRIHRVNGYLQDSRRIFTDQTASSSGNSARSALVEKLSTSIRSRSTSRRIRRQSQYLNTEGWPNCNFESLDSLSSTNTVRPGPRYGTQRIDRAHENETRDTLRNNKQSEMAAKGSSEQQLHEAVSSLMPNEHPVGAYWNCHGPTKSQQSHQSVGSFGPDSPTLFSFPLISLQEAARREALKTEAENRDSLTATSGARTRKNSSIDASKTTQRTTPLTPYITKPLPAHSRSPSALRYVHTAAPSQERVAMGHGRGVSNVTYRSGTPQVTPRSALSRSFRVPLEPGERSSHAFPRPPSAFNSPRLVARDQRHLTRGTSVAVAADLRQIVSFETGHPFGVTSEDAYLSWEARRRRQAYYYFMCMLCIFPFIAPLVYRGTFDSGLSWYTRGETGQLSQRQRRNVLIVGCFFSAVWVCVLAVFVTVVVNNSKQQHHST
ncbi:hypothetical protein C8A03DRAFT_15397 [Achaetomium macrosporum]|uniref:Uncharacterized protein n=1 Tax=Achaetomium macrosporum TaxID=79813 RepID=A0AAN7C9Y7_9PEZI|nr:hypothetical protein C8A03DRAFT_15397 [Achaetomium macrosporum]